MSKARALDFQIACLRDAGDNPWNEEITEGVEAAIKTLEWMARNESILKLLVALRKNRPDVFAAFEALLKAFPEAAISDVRDKAA